MNFADLYRYANGLGTRSIKVTILTNFVKEMYYPVGEIEYFGVNLDENVSLGHMILEFDRTSPHEEEFVNASIRYSRGLNRCWRRLVCCKELMHVLDGRTERVNTRERFIKLMEELESRPLTPDTSLMYESEREAMWMAFLVLCPENIRNQMLEKHGSSLEGLPSIADELKLPVNAVRSIMSDYYQTALERLTGEPLRRAKAPALAL